MPGLSSLSAISGLSGIFAGGVDIPLTIDGLLFWVKADTGTYQDSAKATLAASDGDVIGAWEDQSGNGNDVVQGTTANKPTLRLNVVNSKPIVRFDGINDSLGIAAFVTAVPFTIFYVGVHTLGVAGPGISVSNSGVANQSFGTAVNAAEDVSCWIFDVAFVESTIGTVAAPFLGAGRWNAITDYTAILNGVEGVSATHSAPAGINRFNLGTLERPAPVWYEGDMAEVIVYDTALSDADRALIETYLNGRYAIF